MVTATYGHLMWANSRAADMARMRSLNAAATDGYDMPLGRNTVLALVKAAALLRDIQAVPLLPRFNHH